MTVKERQMVAYLLTCDLSKEDIEHLKGLLTWYRLGKRQKKWLKALYHDNCGPATKQG